MAKSERGGRRAAAVLAVTIVFFGAILAPLGRPALTGLVLALAAVIVAAWRRARWLGRLESAFSGRPRRQNTALLAGTLIVVLGGLEYAARVLTELGLVASYRPMETMLRPGTEDWRMAHITADRFREPDPILLWRPVPRAPYNRQRFKGPVVEIPKPPGVFRIVCYGDSNTDGPDRDGWPALLQTRLESRPEAKRGAVRYQVLNGGVAGYSSHQGLLRFRQEVERFEPDLVLVSFGWNDLADALGEPDRTFRPPPAWLARLQRVLLRYRAYRVALAYWQAARPPPEPPGEPGPRVPIEDYRANLRGFFETARGHGAGLVLLTRPHNLERTPRVVPGSWRFRVERYNRELLRFGERRGLPVIDVDGIFAARHPDSFSDASHFDARGRARMAELLEHELDARGLLSNLEP